MVIDYVLVETTGMADPGVIASMVIQIQAMLKTFIIVIVLARHRTWMFIIPWRNNNSGRLASCNETFDWTHKWNNQRIYTSNCFSRSDYLEQMWPGKRNWQSGWINKVMCIAIQTSNIYIIFKRAINSEAIILKTSHSK